MKQKLKEISLESVAQRINHLDQNFDGLRMEMREGFERIGSELGKLGVKYEDIDSKFRLLLEGFGGLDKRMQAFEERTEERFEGMDYQFDVVFKLLDDVDGRFDGVDGRLNDIDERLAKGIQTRGAFGI